MKKVLVLLGILFSINTVFSQNIIKAEYFFDADPGQGNGVAVPNFTPGEIVNFSFTIPTSGLSNGFHFLNIRAADINGIWTRYETRYFYLSTTNTNTTNVIAAEYFVDRDTVPGSGTPINIGTSGSTVNFTLTFPATLSSGFHSLGIRVKDQEGKWSIFEERSFYIAPDPVDAPPIVAAEYFFDVDPGIGSASSLSVTTPGNIVTQTFLVPVPNSLSQGDHVLAIRVKDQQGHWSFYASETITVGAASGSITCPGNVTVNPYTNDCKMYVFNIDAVGLSQNDSSYRYTLTGATTGSGVGTASGLLFNAGVTTVTYTLINSPTISCSFTVTVNSSVTPTASISMTPSNPFCEGNLVIFSCNSTNGGSANTTWQWKKNGINVGTSNSTYRDTTLLNHDTITVTMTSAISCAVPKTVTSSPIIMSLHERVYPSVSITANTTSICPGQSVTFTATAINGGTQPIYQWVKNGVMTDQGAVYQTSSLSNGDSVYVILYNTTDCIPNTNITSNVIHITVGQSATPSVTIATPSYSICPGQTVTFTATPNNAGNNPVYEWTLNNNAVGTNSPTYQSSTLKNGDNVRVTMAPSQSCGNNTPVYSNTITMNVGTALTPSVSISSSAIDICAGTSVTFTATPANGGNTPSYQWKLNGNNVGNNSATYQTSSLNNADTIRVVMTSSLSCVSVTTATSNYISMDVTLPASPSVSIVSTVTSICTGQSVTFTATPVNGGSSPVYQWKINGNNAGTNSNTFQTSSLANGDAVSVSMMSSLPCVTASTVNSNSIPVSVSQTITYYRDLDGDGYGSSTSGTIQSCTVQAGYVSNNSDCDDNNATAHPGVTEVCGNGIDDDCNGLVDENCVKDPDNDGDGYTVGQGDCNDSNAAIHPGAIEICNNNIDDDCDGQVDENCAQGLPTLTIKTYPIKEGDAGFTTLTVDVTLDRPAPVAVTVKYKSINDDAIAGLDYESTSGTITIPAGKTSGSLQVRIIGDLLREKNERFDVNFSDPVNVLLPADPNSRIMIIDDDKGKPNSAANSNEVTMEQIPFKIPTVTSRNQVWMIPQISNYENEVLILNVQGQVVSRFINYKNQTFIGSVATGLYFYQIRIRESGGQYKYYSGRLFITE